MTRIRFSPFLMISLVAICAVAAPTTNSATKPVAGGIENPQYKAWANFKVGTRAVTRGSNVQAVERGEEKGELKTDVEIEQTLVQLTPDKAVVDTTTKTTQDGNPKPMQIRKIVYPRLVAKDELDELGKGFDPELLGKVTEQSVTVAAGTFKAKVVEFEKRQGKNPVKIKCWFSYEVPGGTLKQEYEASGKTVLELASVDKK
jgi:hypothetical protein